jgi:tripartite-type tricarboxylate transporter receptor subunit TctC
MTDLLGGQVQLMFSDAPTALPHIKSGRVRALGVGSPKRSALVPDVPTIAESGVKGYDAYSWAGVFAPAGTPKEILVKVNGDIVKALSDPEVKKRLLEAGAEAAPGTPEQFGAFLKGEIAKWGKVVKDANIKAD